MIEPRIDDTLSGSVLLGLVEAGPVSVGDSSEALLDEIARTTAATATAFAGVPPSAVEGLRPARELYRTFGIDPTKLRPSSEALFRRAVRGKPFPRISNAVDLGNLVALRSLLSLGLYDVDRIVPPVALRRGFEGESYRGVRKDDVHLGGRPVLADAEGPFGNPTADSFRTAVTESTRSVWMVVFAPSSVAEAWLGEQLDAAAELMRLHLGGATNVAVVQ